MKNTLLKLCFSAAVAAALATSARAGTRTWNFDNWAEITNLVFASSDGVTWQDPTWVQWSAFGNPESGGFLQLTPAIGSRNLAVVFPDIDDGAAVKAFKLTMDVRAGNGTEHAADGFSISYVRENDPALTNALAIDPGRNNFGNLMGFAGGDSVAQALDPAGSPLPENGSKTGVAIAFDCWAGNRLPDTPDQYDREGIAVRVDDRTLTQVSLTSWNGGCADVNSLQTGAWLNDGGSSFTHLEWCRLEVEKTVDNKVNVTWKGRKILDGYQLNNYSPHKGRLILAGRTGGSYQYVHFDNITLETTPAIEPVLKSLAVKDDLRGWSLQIEDTPPSVLTNVSKVLWNDTDVTSLVTVSKDGLITTVTLNTANRLPAGSVNVVKVTMQSSLGQVLEGVANATTPDYFVMPTAYALPLSAVSGQPRGIALGQIWQTLEVNGNSQGNNKLNWTEEQLLGLHGTNLITSQARTWTDVMDFQNDGDTGTTANGNFFVGGSALGFWDGADYSLRELGFGSNPDKTSTDDGTIEWFTYVYFPTAGDYYMIVNSDDGFRLTTARHAKDRMGDVISFFNDGRGNGQGLGAGTSQRVIVDQPGVYPIRGIIENQGGGFNVEWYTRVGTNLFLVNSNSTPEALQAWQSATGVGCYVQSAIPVRDAVDVSPTQKIQIELANGNTTVNASSIVLKVNGNVVTPTITSGTTTKIELPPIGPGGYWPSASVNTIELAFNDSASTAYSYKWNFTAAPYKVLSGGLPLGSEDSSKVGFMYNTYQVNPGGTTQLPNRIHVAEQVLRGWWGPNVATLASGPVNGVINFNINTDDQGNFHDGNGYPEELIPGIPGTAGSSESFACEILTYIEFPAAGMYTLGFNSDDGFWSLSGLAQPSKVGQLTIHSPASIAGDKAAVLPAYNSGQDVQTTNDVTGELVLANPIMAESGLVNAAQVAGKIAVCYRGAVTFASKIQNCAAAGAIGVIIVQNRPDAAPGEGVFPIEMGSTLGPIPAVMIHLADGNAITNALLSGPVMGTLNAAPKLNDSLGYADYGKGASDITYNVLAPTPGLYPIRTVWWQGGGGGNAEWFSIKDGVKTLLNDRSNPNALKTWYGVMYVPPPTLTVARDGSDIVVTFTGTLQSANTVTGPYSDVSGATSPYRSPISAAPKFFRARQ